jgi:hypothetical protein
MAINVVPPSQDAPSGIVVNVPSGTVKGTVTATVSIPAGTIYVTSLDNTYVSSVTVSGQTATAANQVINFTTAASGISVNPNRWWTPLAASSNGTFGPSTAFGSSNGVSGVVYGNNFYVAHKSMTDGYPGLFASTNLTTWTTRDITGWSTRGVTEAAFGAGTFVLSMGTRPALVGPSLATSTDTITWTSRAPQSSTDRAARLLKFENNLFWYALSNQNGNSGPDVYTSTNGTTWTQRSVTMVTASLFVNGASFGNGVYVVGGGEGITSTSTNLVNWTTRDASIWGGPTDTIEQITFGNGIFVAVGSGGRVATSTDAVSWTQRTPGVGTGSFQDVYFMNGYFIATYNPNPASLNNTIISTDGINWTTRRLFLGTGTSTGLVPRQITYVSSSQVLAATTGLGSINGISTASFVDNDLFGVTQAESNTIVDFKQKITGV